MGRPAQMADVVRADAPQRQKDPKELRRYGVKDRGTFLGYVYCTAALAATMRQSGLTVYEG